MALQPSRNLLSCLGFVIWGDLGPLTIYRSKRGKIVAFPKTWPKTPASPQQAVMRNRLSANAAGWTAQPAAVKHAWDQAARTASLCMTGYNLMQHYCLTNDHAAIRTLERQTNQTLLPEYPRFKIHLKVCASYWDFDRGVSHHDTATTNAFTFDPNHPDFYVAEIRNGVFWMDWHGTLTKTPPQLHWHCKYYVGSGVWHPGGDWTIDYDLHQIRRYQQHIDFGTPDHAQADWTLEF